MSSAKQFVERLARSCSEEQAQLILAQGGISFIMGPNKVRWAEGTGFVNEAGMRVAGRVGDISGIVVTRAGESGEVAEVDAPPASPYVERLMEGSPVPHPAGVDGRPTVIVEPGMELDNGSTIETGNLGEGDGAEGPRPVILDELDVVQGLRIGNVGTVGSGGSAGTPGILDDLSGHSRVPEMDEEMARRDGLVGGVPVEGSRSEGPFQEGQKNPDSRVPESRPSAAGPSLDPLAGSD